MEKLRVKNTKIHTWEVKSMDKKEMKLHKELEEERHNNKIEEIQFEFDCKRKVEAKKHDNELESHRIKNADIQRSIAQKQRGNSAYQS